MRRDLSEFNRLVNAEDYFEFFKLPYNSRIVSVNRLHILQKFSQSITEIDAAAAGVSEEERLNQYRNALQQAYEVFLTSTPMEQKLFKVFKSKPQNVVLLTEINSAD